MFGRSKWQFCQTRLYSFSSFVAVVFVARYESESLRTDKSESQKHQLNPKNRVMKTRSMQAKWRTQDDTIGILDS